MMEYDVDYVGNKWKRLSFAEYKKLSEIEKGIYRRRNAERYSEFDKAIAAEHDAKKKAEQKKHLAASDKAGRDFVLRRIEAAKNSMATQGDILKQFM